MMLMQVQEYYIKDLVGILEMMFQELMVLSLFRNVVILDILMIAVGRHVVVVRNILISQVLFMVQNIIASIRQRSMILYLLEKLLVLEFEFVHIVYMDIVLEQILNYVILLVIVLIKKIICLIIRRDYFEKITKVITLNFYLIMIGTLVIYIVMMI